MNGKRLVYPNVSVGWSDLLVTIDMWLKSESGEVTADATWFGIAAWHQHNAGRPANPDDERSFARAVSGILGVDPESTLLDYLRPKPPVVEVPAPAAEKPPRPEELVASELQPPPSS